MSTTLIITSDAILGLLVIAAVAALVHLAHRLPETAPHSDETWGIQGDAWVASDPLPLRQLAAHEDERELQRAA
ncbi:MAG: hypothetical protein H0X39_04380 [Actinobacteria bacterium]|nr:hypothetical protein [Actinomycetota bacterium]